MHISEWSGGRRQNHVFATPALGGLAVAGAGAAVATVAAVATAFAVAAAAAVATAGADAATAAVAAAVTAVLATAGAVATAVATAAIAADAVALSQRDAAALSPLPLESPAAVLSPLRWSGGGKREAPPRWLEDRACCLQLFQRYVPQRNPHPASTCGVAAGRGEGAGMSRNVVSGRGGALPVLRDGSGFQDRDWHLNPTSCQSLIYT